MKEKGPDQICTKTPKYEKQVQYIWYVLITLDEERFMYMYSITFNNFHQILYDLTCDYHDIRLSAQWFEGAYSTIRHDAVLDIEWVDLTTDFDHGPRGHRYCHCLLRHTVPVLVIIVAERPRFEVNHHKYKYEYSTNINCFESTFNN